MWTFILFMLGVFIVAVLVGSYMIIRQNNTNIVSDKHSSKDMIKVNLKDFTSNYGSGMEFDDFLKYQDMMLRGIYTVTLSQEYVENIKNRYMNNKEKEALLFRTAELNNKGLELEMQGDIDGAISIYEENIKGGSKSTHSYDRLMILYRKAKEYDHEIRVINKALDVFSDDSVLVEQYQYRLKRANYYKSKVKGIR